jgi:hypothetical protein
VKKHIRPIALILAHVGLLLSIIFLIFFIVCSIKAQNASDTADENDQYLSQAINQNDFSVYTVGRALSDRSDPAKENLFIALDLVIPLLFLASGVLLQIAFVHKRRKHPALPQQKPSQSINHRR